MPVVDSIKLLEFVLVFLVPGLVALYARSQFLTGGNHNLKEAIPVYLSLTLVYYGLVFPFAEYVVSVNVNGWWRITMWLLLLGVGPLLFGSLLGIVASFGIVKKLISFLGISVVHPMPTAWDYKLSKSEQQFVFVTLKNGTRFAGRYGGKSFASSEPNERDLYLEEIYDWSGSSQWKTREGSGVWLTGSEIQSIEFK
jgi:Family of unknown function (DUF6338)